MSNGNVALVKSLYEAFGRGEIGTIVGAVTADASWEIVGRKSDFPTFGMFRGPAGVEEFFGAVGQNLDFTEFAPKEFYSTDDKVFVLGHYTMKIKKTGRPMQSDWIHVFSISGGKVAGFREFTDTAQAVEGQRA
jgi:ketosteroid isomerase-like protein